MTDIDNEIRKALEEEDREWFDKLSEPALPMQVIESFGTRSRWFIAGAMLSVFGFMGVCIFSGFRLAQAQDPREVAVWSLAMLGGCLAIMAIKIWYWMELQKNTIVRELKRLELQVARLSQR